MITTPSNDNSRVLAPVQRKRLIGPFFIAFALVALWNLFSYPVQQIYPSYLYTVVLRSLPTSGEYEHTAYLATIISFSVLILGYFLGPGRRWAQEFQQKQILLPTPHRLFVIWFILSILILLCCTIMYVQADYSFPLLVAGNMDRHDYNIFRKEIGASVSPTLINLLLYLVHPFQILVAFVVVSCNRKLFRLGTALLLGLTSLFLLARSSITIPILVSLMGFLAYRAVRLRTIIMPTIVMILLGAGMMAYSTKDLSTLADDFLTRVVHGQWVGLPLYFWYFEDARAPVGLSVHPALRELLGIADDDTPGRELMRYVIPAAAEGGGAGNIPTYFIGEAYVFGGWWLVFFSVVHVLFVITLFAWAFTRIPKTLFSCTIYGLVVYKISSGLSSGISAFYVSGVTGLLIICIIWALFMKANKRVPQSLDDNISASTQKELYPPLRTNIK